MATRTRTRLPRIRQDLLDLMKATLADEQRRRDWDYREVRPLVPTASWRPGTHVVGDCSKGVQYLCRWAGAPDPMGRAYDGWGNSTTIAAHLEHLDRPERLKVGDVVTFGPYGTQHAAMVMVTGRDPLLWSFGHQGAPNTYRLSHDGRVAQYLRLYVPPVVEPTPSTLRSETGYWSWLAWVLGEGAWRSYGKANREVRPAVPAIVPTAWWRARLRFVRQRRKGNRELAETP